MSRKKKIPSIELAKIRPPKGAPDRHLPGRMTTGQTSARNPVAEKSFSPKQQTQFKPFSQIAGLGRQKKRKKYG
jgi:hypothetical protein